MLNAKGLGKCSHLRGGVGREGLKMGESGSKSTYGCEDSEAGVHIRIEARRAGLAAGKARRPGNLA